ncbi:MAG: OmpA family protein [Bacteroidota bacterium]
MLKRFLVILLILFSCCHLGITMAASDPNDREGSKDPPLFNRMPGYFIYSYSENEFDRFEFQTGPNKKQILEGHRYSLVYKPNEGIKKSGMQIVRNYANAVKTIGGQEIYNYESGTCATLKVVKNTTETWVFIGASPNGIEYVLEMIEKEGMNQDIVADAASLARSIKDTGKAAVYGIYFDSGKALIKMESQPALEEIAKLLKVEPKLKLYVVGHTDNVGTFDYNMKLSKDRADSVVKALTGKYGIAATRLMACGDGPTAPVASNDTEEGRAKNRRVELVKQ